VHINATAFGCFDEEADGGEQVARKLPVTLQ